MARSPTLTLDRNLAAAIATTRFGLGARPGEIDRALADPQRYLTGQIRAEGADFTQDKPATTLERERDFLAYRADRAADKQNGTPKSPVEKAAHKELRDEIADDFMARVQHGVATPDSFRERWALFWTNHFAVSAGKMTAGPFVGPFENEAIRPHVFGRFEDLLVASSTHTAMLHYLDQAQSIGPNSFAAQYQAKQGKHSGLNENLAREIMELHTVGLEAAYSQADVTEFARAMTGWSVGGEHDPPDRMGLFVFHPRAHEPGARTIMGKQYSDGGLDQARAVMKDLAASPHTANHLATKIARHFVADDPAPSLGGATAPDLPDEQWATWRIVARSLMAAPEAWDPAARKFKTPYEFLVSSVAGERRLGRRTWPIAAAVFTLHGPEAALRRPRPRGGRKRRGSGVLPTPWSSG